MRVLKVVRGVVHARKEGDDASIVGFGERVEDVGKPLARLVVCTREEVLFVNGHDVTARLGHVSPGMERG
jgi:hypothetical protein